MPGLALMGLLGCPLGQPGGFLGPSGGPVGSMGSPSVSARALPVFGIARCTYFGSASWVLSGLCRPSRPASEAFCVEFRVLGLDSEIYINILLPDTHVCTHKGMCSHNVGMSL